MGFAEFKLAARTRVRPVVLALDGLGLTPLGVSVIGLLITAVSGLIIARGNLFLGAIVFLIGSGFDMLDGDLARLQGTVSRRGAFLDSCFDRLGEAFLFAGLTWYFATLPQGADPVSLVLITAVVVGSLTTSYVRARAEGVGETCFVGLLQRTERVIILAVGLLFGRWLLVPVLWFLAIATLATTIQRIVHVAAKLPGPEPRSVAPTKTEAPEGEADASAPSAQEPNRE
jgi:phosphatidylglycerophosphate synthase